MNTLQPLENTEIKNGDYVFVLSVYNAASALA